MQPWTWNPGRGLWGRYQSSSAKQVWGEERRGWGDRELTIYGKVSLWEDKLPLAESVGRSRTRLVSLDVTLNLSVVDLSLEIYTHTRSGSACDLQSRNFSFAPDTSGMESVGGLNTMTTGLWLFPCLCPWRSLLHVNKEDGEQQTLASTLSRVESLRHTDYRYVTFFVALIGCGAIKVRAAGTLIPPLGSSPARCVFASLAANHHHHHPFSPDNVLSGTLVDPGGFRSRCCLARLTDLPYRQVTAWPGISLTTPTRIGSWATPGGGTALGCWTCCVHQTSIKVSVWIMRAGTRCDRTAPPADSGSDWWPSLWARKANMGARGWGV